MRTFVVAVVTACALAATVPGVAGATLNDPSPGSLCSLSTVTDVTGSSFALTGEVSAGPIMLTDDTDPTIVYSGYIGCSIQLGVNNTHADQAVLRINGPITPAAVALEPTQVTFDASSNDTVYLCTRIVVVGGPTIYWNDADDGFGNGGWSTSSTSRCRMAISATAPEEVAAAQNDLDPFVCPVLETLPALGIKPPSLWGCYKDDLLTTVTVPVTPLL